jgi:hypothetical protein
MCSLGGMRASNTWILLTRHNRVYSETPNFHIMRGQFFICASLAATLAQSQWLQVHPQYSIVGLETLQHDVSWLTMTGPDNGFLAEGANPPGSSGPSFWIHHTDDDWNNEATVSGSGGDLSGSCCTSILLSTYSPATVFYYKPMSGPSGPLYSTTVTDGVVQNRVWAPYPAAIQRMSPMNGTTLFAVQYLTYGTFFSVKRTEEEASYIDTLPGIPSKVVFLNADQGAMLTDLTSGARKLLITLDGGYTWTPALSDPAQSIQDAQWAPDGSLWLVGNQGLLIRSLDLGQNWDTLASFTDETLLSVAPYSGDSAWVSGLQGFVAVTGNAGDSWTDRSIEDTLSFRIQGFIGALYATSVSTLPLPNVGRRVYRYGTLAGFEEFELAPLRWATNSDGVVLQIGPNEGEVATEIYDASGRLTGDRQYGPTLRLRGHDPGLYHLRIETNKRKIHLKVVWVGQH